jgi:hypothetical protein
MEYDVASSWAFLAFSDSSTFSKCLQPSDLAGESVSEVVPQIWRRRCSGFELGDASIETTAQPSTSVTSANAIA